MSLLTLFQQHVVKLFSLRVIKAEEKHRSIRRKVNKHNETLERCKGASHHQRLYISDLQNLGCRSCGLVFHLLDSNGREWAV
jgi:hypothetical protein